ncbi:uncharacterized protein LOC128553943, partial [Mercenaria mercenaria]|uniref:uncharacterized protein LOC128553943 n=1 Tax=Mercenaria mercenaria TaxID=6596 RepID=UPI00234E8627
MYKGRREFKSKTSERRLTSSNRSVVGSDEYKDERRDDVLKCDPCSAEGSTVDAQKFCQDCKEYLCSMCVRNHAKYATLKKHVLVDKDTDIDSISSRASSDLCTEHCYVHSREYVKFYCPRHNDLGCHDCMTMNHRICRIEFIPDILENFQKSEEYDNIVKNMNGIMSETSEALKVANKNSSAIQEWHASTIAEMQKYHTEINAFFTKNADEIEQKAKDIKSVEIKKVNETLQSCKTVKTEIEKELDAMNKMVKNRNFYQLFVAVKKYTVKVESYGPLVRHACCEKIKPLIFEKSGILRELRDAKMTMGSVTHSDIGLDSTKSMVSGYASRAYKGEIDVSSPDESRRNWITGSILLSPDILVITDYRNASVKVIDIQAKKVVSFVKMSSGPRDITHVPKECLAVAKPEEKAIELFTVSNLAKIREFKVSGSCYGLCCHKDKLVVSFQKPPKIEVMDLNGTVLSSYSTDMIEKPLHVVCRSDGKEAYISDEKSDSVLCLNLVKDTTRVVRKVNIDGLKGIAICTDGSLFACSSNNHSIFHIMQNGDAEIVLDAESNVVRPYTVSFCEKRNRLYVSSNLS